MTQQPANDATAEALFEQALATAEKHLEAAMKESTALSDYVAVAMIEAAVNQAVEATSAEDIVDMLRDLADQIENSEDEDGDDEGEDDEA